MQETWVQSLRREDLLEKSMAIHSSILAWRIPWTEEPGGLQGRRESDTIERLTLSLSQFQLRPWRSTTKELVQFPLHSKDICRLVKVVPPKWQGDASFHTHRRMMEKLSQSTLGREILLQEKKPENGVNV